MTRGERQTFCGWHTTDTSHLHSPRIKPFSIEEDEDGINFGVVMNVGFVQKHLAQETVDKLNQIIRDIADGTEPST